MVSTNLPALLDALAGNAVHTPINTLFYNERNLDDGLIRPLNAFGTDDISPGQFAQLLDMIQHGHFRSVDGGMDYYEALANLRTPALWLAGSVDNLATVGAVQMAYNQYGGPNKQYILFGRVNGQAVDYGHDDLIISPSAAKEVWPRLVDWLARFDPKKTLGQKLLEPMKDLVPAKAASQAASQAASKPEG